MFLINCNSTTYLKLRVKLKQNNHIHIITIFYHFYNNNSIILSLINRCHYTLANSYPMLIYNTISNVNIYSLKQQSNKKLTQDLLSKLLVLNIKDIKH